MIGQDKQAEARKKLAIHLEAIKTEVAGLADSLKGLNLGPASYSVEILIGHAWRTLDQVLITLTD